jgi:hypothetical protein
MLRHRVSRLRQYRDVLCDVDERRRQHARRCDHYRGRQPGAAAPAAAPSARRPATTRDFNADAGATFSGSMMVGTVIASEAKQSSLPQSRPWIASAFRPSQ